MSASNWLPGTSLRLSRLFNDKYGRSVIVAMDHGFGGAHPGLENPGETIKRLLSAEPDGIIVTPGTARKFQSAFAGKLAPAMIVSIDYVLFHPFPGSKDIIEEQGVVSSVEEALRLGADAIKVLMIFGRSDPSMQARNFDMIGRFADHCHQWGMPIIIEPTTWGHKFTQDEKKNVNVLRDMARVAFEFGADIVKSDFPDDPNEFQEIVNSCPVPVTVLGGAKTSDTESLLRAVVKLTEHGAAGVTFGRNVWQHADPERFIRCLKHCVYEMDLVSALAEINDPEVIK